MRLESASTPTTNYHFRLYLYPSTESPDMFHQERKPNLADWLLPKLSAAYGFTPTPEDVLAYIYAVLYSPTYRQQYAQELRTDFPRLPFYRRWRAFPPDGRPRPATD
jgi:predicted helicase